MRGMEADAVNLPQQPNSSVNFLEIHFDVSFFGALVGKSILPLSYNIWHSGRTVTLVLCSPTRATSAALHPRVGLTLSLHFVQHVVAATQEG